VWMSSGSTGLFLPGFGARAHAYAAGLPLGWNASQPPPPRSTGGSLAGLRTWAVSEIADRQGRTLVAGHSMGAALAVLAAVSAPEHVSGLLLIAPAGLPLRKPLRRSATDFARQLAARTYPVHDVVAGARELVAAPRSAARLVRALRRLDLSGPMVRVRAAGIPTVVVGCTTDTLVPPDHSRRVARLLGAEYRELDVAGGHIWMLRRPSLMASILESGIAR
jgi:pimeloyl-ACP methyl ester carboxylesterase